MLSFSILLLLTKQAREFFVPEISKAGSALYLDHLIQQKVTEYNRKVVKVTTIDRFLKEEDLDHIDITKIDVEGAELSLLNGAHISLKEKRIDKLLIEVHKTINTSKKT